jgi:hypothetical protein
MTNHRFLLAAAASAWAVAAAAGQAVPFTEGNLVVLQVGDGAATLNSAATPAFLSEVQISGGAIVQTIPLPTEPSGANRALTVSGSASSEGVLTRSVDARYLTLTGYDAPVGTTSVAGTQSSAVNRVVARVDAGALIDTTTAFDAYNAGNIRGAVSTDGSDIWTSGTSGSSGGIRYVLFGSADSVMVAPTPTNIRVVNIFGGQLYASTMSGAFFGVNAVGAGLPTTSGNTVTQLTGMPPSGSPDSAYDFFFADANTLYIADDRSAASGGGIKKWTFDGVTWTLQYTLGLGAGARGLTGIVSGGVTTLYATTAESNGNRLVSIADTDPSAQFVLIAQAAANTAWRGVDFAPTGSVPPPACYANCDSSTQVPFLNVLDFNCFLNQFSAGAGYANCDGSVVEPVLNVLDFNCFLNRFSAGCSAP